MSVAATPEAVRRMEAFFHTGATRPYSFRRQALLDLRDAMRKYEDRLHAALLADLKKSPEESYVTETGFVLAEISHTLGHLKRWMQPRKVTTNLLNFPSSSKVLAEPLGVVLIIGPWNYPLQLLFTPLIGALAAGNCVVLKPSEFAPATADAMREIIGACFPPELVLYAEGAGAVVVPDLMRSHRFAHVFYTGSTAVGGEIYKLAAESLVPVTLELGGKSPCVVAADANIKVAARRIAVTKFSNAGQMCVAPDYVLVHRSVKDALVAELKECIRRFFTDNPAESDYYGTIINERQARRLAAYLEAVQVLHGGRHDIGKLYMEPTLVAVPDASARILQEEIFGPILPVLAFDTMAEAVAIIRKQPDPLAFYVYTESGDAEKSWLAAVPSGGACINNCSWHLTNPNLPFGGRGNSGIGAYHGRDSFTTFSHQRAVMKTPTWFDPDLKYPPFKGKLGLFKRVIR